MSIFDNDFLSRQGWDGFFAQAFKDPFLSTLSPARVVGEERGLYRLQWQSEKMHWGSLSGKMQYRARSREDLPTVGDWVLVDIPPDSDRAIIHGICPRKTLIRRQQASSSNAEVQTIAANVDTVFIATSLNEDFNIRRLHRYMAVVLECGACPVILLTKSDLQEDQGVLWKNEVQKEFSGVAVHSVAMMEFDEALFFKDYLGPGQTVVLMGSSGVGKSTLVNYLTGGNTVKTQDIREDDGKGRHTTTSRGLFPTRFEGWIIDTPGLRELSLLDHELGLQTQFSDIESLLGQCRFTDCQHQNEPDCAIRKALDEGLISSLRWESYMKLQAEIRHAMRKQDRALSAEDRKRWKKLTLEGQTRGRMKRQITGR